MMSNPWNRVTIVGCGLVGASFALALRRAGVCRRVAGWDSGPAILDEALARGIIDEVDSSFAGDGESLSDLIYLALPVRGIIGFLRESGVRVRRGALVTDAGSTKAEICDAARAYLPDGRHFVGGHPIAGSHRAGIAHARADLFDSAPYVLVSKGSDGEGERQCVAALEETLKLVGARVVWMTAAEHDRAMAFVSHAPQILSSVLAATINDQADAEMLLNLSGAGYRDMTRLAASSWAVWRDILQTNPTPIVAALDLLTKKLNTVRDELQQHPEHGANELTRTGELFQRPLRE
ncbi:MAG TPA: prephenate dehydrogenase/arogenate dehydrogenase family protein [Pyrinomonadaceae bacterium]|nr:prephenate dehydrogenase/arogenate dehydrogenase family protein [Pyrinomonadaceae bacterium]